MLEYGIGITGGIAVGKSSVSKIIQQYQFQIIDADSISHQILEECKDLIIQKFGEKIITNNTINRRILGEIVFQDKKKRGILESILHPKIRERILESAQKLDQKKYPYFLDIPLFFESGGRSEYPVKFILCISCLSEQQIQRLMSRNHLTKDQALLRIKTQMPLEEKCKRSDFIIQNDKSLKELHLCVLNFLKKIASIYKISYPNFEKSLP